MSNITQQSPRQELHSMLTEGRNQELVAYAEQSKYKLLSDWIGGDTESLQRELRLESALLVYAENLLQEIDDSRFAALKLGTLLGTVESLEKAQYEQNQRAWIHARFSMYPVKHLPEIIHALETHGSMSHSELSAYLNMNPPTLSEAMKKILPTGALQSSTIGKYKIYSLSDAGIRYGKELRKNRQVDQSLHEICERINALVQCVVNPDELHRIKSSIMSQFENEPANSIHAGSTMHLYDSDHPRDLPEKFRVESMINDLGSDDIILKGHWETESKWETKLTSTSNKKAPKLFSGTSKRDFLFVPEEGRLA